MINENCIIQRLSAKSQGFIGDDAAILPPLSQSQYVISKDLLIEDVHFRTSYFSASNLAHKSLHVNLSDLSAMGAEPLYILCGISIPPSLEKYAEAFLEKLTDLCEKMGVILIGGDTTAAKNKLSISITAIGKARNNAIKRRNTATKDDVICIAGQLGWAHLGLTALESSININSKYINAFLHPIAKIKEGVWLAGQDCITSMMDLSDGLYVDLKRLCQSSGCGAVIDLNYLFCSKNFESTCHYFKFNPTEIMLMGGEDYSLLFTCKKEAFDRLSTHFAQQFQYTVKHVGHITQDPHILFHQDGEKINLSIKPFTHFGEIT